MHLTQNTRNTSIQTRAFALVDSVLVTFGALDLIANYGPPCTPVALVASAAG